MKISEIRRHSESLGNFRADNKNLHIKTQKKDIANQVSENKHSEQLFPLKVKENTKGNTSLSCDNIGTLEVLFEDSKSKTMKSVNGMDNKHQDSAGGAWRVLEEEISDVNLLIQTYSEKESVQGKVTLARLPHISMSNFIKFKSQVQTKRSSEKNESEINEECQNKSVSFTQTYPIAGAVLGSCVGGPVGLLAGIKFGGLASVSGIVFGKM